MSQILSEKKLMSTGGSKPIPVQFRIGTNLPPYLWENSVVIRQHNVSLFI